jgi:lipopolysaccharide heptosyltransferase II
MFSHLQIPNRRERAIVGTADLALDAAAGLARLFHNRRSDTPPARVLVLRLERIGDLLMVIAAIRRLKELLPRAEIDLAVGSWNRTLAGLIPGITRTEVVDAPWLSREAGAMTHPRLIARALTWRERQYDMVLNFEPDIRSNFLAWLSGAQRRLGYSTGGGGAFLTEALSYDPRVHVSDNAMRLVAVAAGHSAHAGTLPPRPASPLIEPASVPAAVRMLDGRSGLLIGVHASGGRAVKQWPHERFRELAQRLIDQYDATIVFTGSTADRPLVDAAMAGLPRDRVVDASGGLELPELAWLVTRLRLFISGDTGPMHLAHAAGTPVVAIFGPSDPVRYAPRGAHDRVVRIDLACSPCNRIRQPPARCTGGTPDCLAGVPVEAVMSAVADVLGRPAQLRRAVEGIRE